jgi:hypothetical protein
MVETWRNAFDAVDPEAVNLPRARSRDIAPATMLAPCQAGTGRPFAAANAHQSRRHCGLWRSACIAQYVAVGQRLFQCRVVKQHSRLDPLAGLVKNAGAHLGCSAERSTTP